MSLPLRGKPPSVGNLNLGSLDLPKALPTVLYDVITPYAHAWNVFIKNLVLLLPLSLY